MTYLKHVLRHKWRMLFQGLPLWLALLHDADKLWPDEFRAYAASFQGDRYHRAGDFLGAWHRHQRRSKHHWQAWVVLDEDGTLKPLPMPARYRREMLADWRAASVGYGRTAADWYAEHAYLMVLHDETRRWVESELGL